MTEVISTQSVVDLAAIAGKFKFPGTVTNVQAFGSGNINDTFLVTVDSLEAQHFVLQRINTQVFRQPELIMQNMRIFSDHVHQRLQYAPPEPSLGSSARTFHQR